MVLMLPDGRRIRVTLCDVRGNDRARIGFDADDDIKILRTEMLDPPATQPRAGG